MIGLKQNKLTYYRLLLLNISVVCLTIMETNIWLFDNFIISFSHSS